MNEKKPYIEGVLAQQDLRFYNARQEADLLYHSATRGASFEAAVRDIIAPFIPPRYVVTDTLLDRRDGEGKQLDLVVHSESVPTLFDKTLPIDWITVAGEVKTVLSDREDLRATASKLSQAAASNPKRTEPVPFLILAGDVRSIDLPRLVADITSEMVQPAVFCFDTEKPVSVLAIGARSPIRLMGEDDEYLDGVATFSSDVMSPSALCYLWLWSAVYDSDPLHGMDFRYMREVVEGLVARDGGVNVKFTAPGEKAVRKRAFFKLPEDWAVPVTVVPREAGSPHSTSPAREPRKAMLIVLGPWVDKFDTWDESAWGGSTTESHRGYGYYEGMPDDELLNACRVFWRFNPKSPTWEGIEYAVVAHAGLIRAVVHIDRFIGPFWGRYGFQGHVVQDFGHLIGRPVPRRSNPVTTIEL